CGGPAGADAAPARHRAGRLGRRPELGDVTMKTIVIDGRTFALPYADFLRPLTKAELAARRESIKQHGIMIAVLHDEMDRIIDGGKGLAVAAEQGIPLDKIPFEVRRGLSEEQKLALALELNESRRQMSADDLKRARVERKRRVVALRQQGESLRTIAVEVGVS